MAKQKLTYATLTADEGIHPEFEAALGRVESQLGGHYPLHIGDMEVTSELGEFTKVSPIDRRVVIGHFQKATSEHAREAISLAKASFQTWASTDWKSRLLIARKIRDEIRAQIFELAALMTLEVGKSRFEAIAEAYEAIDFFSYYLRQISSSDYFETKLKSPVPGEKSLSVLRPHGVFAVISPWNFPLMLANNMAAGAFLTGNTVVMKPSSDSPLTALKLYDIYRKAGVPGAVVSLLTGPGGNFGAEVTKNPEVAALAFTGSKDVGMNLLKTFTTLQPWPKPVISEMGSKNPVIVSDKADLDKAVTGVVRAAFGFQGQKCSAASRAYVQDAVLQSFLEKLVRMTNELKVGDPRVKENFMGPVINEAALQKFRSAVGAAEAAGGRILAGGKVLNEGDLANGYFVQPTIIADLPPTHSLFKEELFLPVLLVASYHSLEEALKLANDTEFGLTAGIFSEDPGEIDYFFNNIQFGVCYANRRGGATTGAWPGAQSFGGWKGSGSTGKGVGGPYYLLQFMREQSRTVVAETKK